MFRELYDFLSSAKLALGLLIIILACCVAGVTLFRGERAWQLIFSTAWFNALLILLVVNVAFCFFPRMWGRKLTTVLFGMILFHLSFVVILLAIIFNSQFYFRGQIRLTEGEVLPSGDLMSYDSVNRGRYFSFNSLDGETKLIRMHRDYMVGNEDKRAAYEIEVGQKGARSHGIIYITKSLEHEGFSYFNSKEGYSLLLLLSNKEGRLLYGAHLPLQSQLVGENMYRYITGYVEKQVVKDSATLFPAPPETPLFALEVEYMPAELKERSGDVEFALYRLSDEGRPDFGEKLARGTVPIGVPLDVGDYLLTAQEVRYWVTMDVRHEPGKPIVLTFLWVSLGGMIITMAGRMMRGWPRVNSGQLPVASRESGEDGVS